MTNHRPRGTTPLPDPFVIRDSSFVIRHSLLSSNSRTARASAAVADGFCKNAWCGPGVVGHAAGQSAQRLQLLRLMELVLQVLAARHVGHAHQEAHAALLGPRPSSAPRRRTASRRPATPPGGVRRPTTPRARPAARSAIPGEARPVPGRRGRRPAYRRSARRPGWPTRCGRRRRSPAWHRPTTQRPPGCGPRGRPAPALRGRRPVCPLPWALVVGNGPNSQTRHSAGSPEPSSVTTISPYPSFSATATTNHPCPSPASRALRMRLSRTCRICGGATRSRAARAAGP
jgi:hypothetical protein